MESFQFSNSKTYSKADTYWNRTGTQTLTHYTRSEDSPRVASMSPLPLPLHPPGFIVLASRGLRCFPCWLEPCWRLQQLLVPALRYPTLSLRALTATSCWKVGTSSCLFGHGTMKKSEEEKPVKQEPHEFLTTPLWSTSLSHVVLLSTVPFGSVGAHM